MSVTSQIRDAIARAARGVVAEPTDKSFLERRLVDTLRAELQGLFPGRVLANRKLPRVEIPDWDPQPGWLDVVVLDDGAAPWIVAEVKLDDVDQTMWDVFKLLSAARLPSVELAIMIAAAPTPTWGSRLDFVEVFEPARGTETVWYSEFFFEEYREAWTHLLKGGRGRPTRVPDSIVVTHLLSAPVLAYPGYELRAIRVADLDPEIYVALENGWPVRTEHRTIPDEELTEDDLPAPDAAEHAYHVFALTTNGYRRMGTNERCGKLANDALDAWRRTGALPSALRELRCCLFFEQRRWHHYGYGFDEEAMRYVRALVEAMRPLVGR